MPKGAPAGQNYADHRTRMGIERAQRNAADRAKRQEWVDWLRDVLRELDAQLALDMGKKE